MDDEENTDVGQPLKSKPSSDLILKNITAKSALNQLRPARTLATSSGLPSSLIKLIDDAIDECEKVIRETECEWSTAEERHASVTKASPEPKTH